MKTTTLLKIVLAFGLLKLVRRAKKGFRALPPVVLAAAALAAAGCMSAVDAEGRLRHKQFEVRGSGLDWLEIAYEPAPGDARFPHPVRLSLVGSGKVEMKSGPSPQVSDPFSQDYANPRWNDLVKETAAFTPDEMREAFQTFVDEGVVATAPAPAPNKLKRPFIEYAGTVNTEKFRYRTDNERLVSLVEIVLGENFGPQLRATSAFGNRAR